MTNLDLSQKVFEFLKQASVKTVVVCAGARNAPIVVALQHTQLDIIHFFEERSASFFALGLIKAFRKPVAIITTSGTAVAEILPAAIEATYQGLPFVIVTADRPKEYRTSGAPQSIQQVGLFSTYVENVYDLDVQTEKFNFEWSYKKPIHLNVCFDEPLIDLASTAGTDSVLSLREKKPSVHTFREIIIKKPLIIVGEMDAQDIPSVLNFIQRTKAVAYAEALSQIRNSPSIQNQMLRSTDSLIKKAFKEKIFDSVIRIGGIPTLRFWRDLEAEFSDVPVYNFSSLPFSGLARKSELYEISQLKDALVQGSNESSSWVTDRDGELNARKIKLMQKFPLSEPACVAQYSVTINETPVYLGNSLPIRHWDAFAESASINLYANRGANGIDGQVSTYLGWSENLSTSFCLIGDLTAMYDLVALGLTPQLRPNRRRIVVLNNFGGQIFQRVFKNDAFTNRHQIQFKNWAQMWDWEYRLVTTAEDFKLFNNDHDLNVVFEIQPDENQTKLFWDEWDLICQKI